MYVHFPGAEGRAGMAAIVDQNENLDLSQLNTELQRTLPPYARPLFIRLIKEADLTGIYYKDTSLCKLFEVERAYWFRVVCASARDTF